MKYYTSTISVPLAEKLKEKGMPIMLIPCNMGGIVILKKYPAITYAEVFDWLMEQGWLIYIGREYNFAVGQVTERFEWDIEKVGSISSQPYNGGEWSDTWHEAAEAAIEKALELIKD